MCCKENHFQNYSPSYNVIKDQTKIYKLENNRIVGEIPLYEVKKEYYKEGYYFALIEASDHILEPTKRFKAEGETINDQRDHLLELIERARREQKLQWQ